MPSIRAPFLWLAVLILSLAGPGSAAAAQAPTRDLLLVEPFIELAQYDEHYEHHHHYERCLAECREMFEREIRHCERDTFGEQRHHCIRHAERQHEMCKADCR